MSATTVDHALIEEIVRGFRTDAHVRMRLPGGGAINLDRKLPYLLVHRQPPDGGDTGTARLLLGESSYLVAGGMPDSDVSEIVRALAEAGTAELGSFLVLEMWSGPAGSDRFLVHAPAALAPESVDALRTGLEALPRVADGTSTAVHTTDDRHASDMPPLLSTHECWQIGCLLLGLEVPPLYRNEQGEIYPVFVRRLRGLLSPVLRQTVFEFARVHTTAGIETYRAIGPRRFGDTLFDIDRRLADIEAAYQFLLLVSPLNSTRAWHEFRDSGFRKPPEFHYRLLPLDPDVLKRRLYNLDLEDVADPAMAFLLRDKRDELDREITMLADRNTSGFRFGSMRLYEPVDDVLLDVARQVLEQLSPGRSDDAPAVGAHEFARIARAEIERYRHALPDLAASVRVRPDLTGLMVSRGNLLIGEGLALRPARVDALLHHEVGTHVLTFYNGRAQPLRQLATGLAGYDELQEGLAVFSEYLAGGLDAARLRLLAGRVVAAHCVEHGADFIETFSLLKREHGFSAGAAFDIAERVHASGGFTRDLIYLRGLLRLIEYIRAGGELEPLFIGKIAARHVDVIGDLMERGFLVPAPLVPSVLVRPEAAGRIDAVRRGLSLLDLVNNPS